MKIIHYSTPFLPLCIVLLFVGQPIYAQDNSATTTRYPSFGIKINPLSPIFAALSGSIEVGLTATTSVQIGAQYWGGFIPTADPASVRVVGITGSFRHYSSKTAPKGFFIEPFVRINSIEAINQTGSIKVYAGGITIGKQWFPTKHFSLELFIGPYYSIPTAVGFNPSYSHNSFFSKTMNEWNPLNGFWVRSGATLGIHL